jgi:hypothetical protein
MTATEELANNRMMIFHGEIRALERVEKLLEKRSATLSGLIGKGDHDHPLAKRLFEIANFQDEIAILKREAREAHVQEMSR